MKQLFLGLIALNLCYLLFQQFSGAAEAPAEPRQADPTQAVPAAKSTQPPVVVAAPAGAPVVAPGITRSGGLVSVDKDKLVALVSPANTPDTVPVIVPEATAKTIPEIERAAPAVSRVQVAASSPATSSSCVIVGPFRRRSQAEQVVERLAKADVAAAIQPRDVAVLPDYMVYVGPQASIGEARALDATFKAAKRDSQIIASGSLRNALSLGVFSRGPLARELQQEMEAEGYKARIATITRNRRGFQVRTELSRPLRAQFLRADTPFIDCPQTIAQR